MKQNNPSTIMGKWSYRHQPSLTINPPQMSRNILGMLPKGAQEAEMQYIPVRDTQEGLSYMMCLWFFGKMGKNTEILLGRVLGRWQVSVSKFYKLYRQTVRIFVYICISTEIYIHKHLYIYKYNGLGGGF